jgi:hypothetical protein
MTVEETQLMNLPVVSQRVAIFWILLSIDLLIIFIAFNTALFMPFGLANMFAIVLFGSISLVAGVWSIVQYSRGKRDQQIYLSLALALVGLMMLAGFLLFLQALTWVII